MVKILITVAKFAIRKEIKIYFFSKYLVLTSIAWEFWAEKNLKTKIYKNFTTQFANFANIRC